MKLHISLLLVASLLLPVISLADIDTNIAVIHSYNSSLGQLPESIAVNKYGTIYVSLLPLAQIRQISPNGAESLLADLSQEAGTGMVGTVGVIVDKSGNVLTVLSSNKITNGVSDNGVWLITPYGKKVLLASMPNAILVNDLVIGPDGNIYVTDSISGTIWQVSFSKGKANVVPWIQSNLLTPNFNIGIFGANGLAFDNLGNLFVSNTTQQTIVLIPVLKNGIAGSPRVFVNLPGQPDGITFDQKDNLIVSLHNNQIALVHPDGSINILLSSGLFDEPSSVKLLNLFGISILYISNFADVDFENPAVLATLYIPF